MKMKRRTNGPIVSFLLKSAPHANIVKCQDVPGRGSNRLVGTVNVVARIHSRVERNCRGRLENRPTQREL